MSASTPRGRGGSSTRGFRGGHNSQSRGSTRGRGDASRGGRGASTASGGAQGLLQQMRTGAIGRGANNNGATSAGQGRGTSRASSASAARSRGRGHPSKSFNNAASDVAPPNSRPSSPFLPGDGASDSGDVQQRYNVLKNLREEERREAIRMGFLADPDKKTTLDKAITPVGTCTEMCPPYERVERIVQMMVDRCERIPDPHGGRPIASEEIMVKRFRRSAAGDDEQVPSDIRTPETLRKTLDYLVDKLVSGPERLAVVHKFTWDRTRAIRNDFSIQQVSKEEDVRIAVECFERIARFHIMALHQLSNPENLLGGENFDVFQEREQLNNTLLSLLYYYDDHRDQIAFPNEAEFRAYHIILAFQSQHPDIEDRVQSWPLHLIADGKVQAALRLYQAAGNTLFDQGPLKPMTPFPVAQNDSGRFWTIMASGSVGYTLACVAELYFNQVRFGALNALWRSCKSAPTGQQAKFRDWTLSVVSEYLGFDEDDQTVDFCANFGLNFATDAQGITYLDFAGHKDAYLDQSSIPKEIFFSHTFVEDKRCRRSLMAIINNVSPAAAIRQGMVEEGDGDGQQHEAEDDGQSLFIPESTSTPKTFGFGNFNPEATSFKPSTGFGSGPVPANSIFGSQTSSVASVSSSFATSANASTAQSTPQFTTSFGAQFGLSSSPANQLSTKFGESAPSTAPTTSADTESSSGWGQTNPSDGTSSLSNQAPKFGTIRQGVEMNNPFGPKPTSDFKAAAASPSSAFAQPESQPQSSTAFNFPSFSAPASKPEQAPPSNGFQFSNPAGDSARPKESPFSFTAAKPALPASATNSSAPQPPPTQQGLPSFSSTPQPTAGVPKPQGQPSEPSPLSQPSFSLPKEINFNFPTAASESKPTPLFQQPSQPDTPKPIFNFAPQAATAQAPIAQAPATDPSQTKTNPLFSAVAPSEQPTKPPTPFSHLTPDSQKPTQQELPQTLPSFKPVSVESPSTGIIFPPQEKPKPAQTTDSPAASPSTASPKATSTTPPLPPVQPQAPTRPSVEKAKLVEHGARLLFSQPGGLIEQFLEYQLPYLLKKLVNQHQEEVRQATLDRLKSAYLYRKYGAIWRSITWRSNLNKRASKRRQMFSQSLRMEAEKKQQHDDELKEILAAVEESKRVREQMLQKQVAEAKNADSKRPDPAQLAGNKRKSLGEPSNGPSPKPASTKTGPYHHKRSRTIGSMLPPPPPKPATSVSGQSQFRHSIFSGRSSLSRSSSTSNLRKSEMRQKQDETKTDYFRLVASGVDPDTPLIPLTARQVEAKKRREKEERELAIARAYNRRRVGPAAIQLSPPQIPTSTTTPISPPVSIPSPAPSTTGSNYDPEADDLLRQLREAREALADDAKWFKEQAEKMGKEVEEENLRSSNGSSQGVPIPERSHYAPSSSFGKSVSRVEQILQRSGKRSLAYKPLHGSDYMPVPMSKRSAQRYSQGENQGEDHGEEVEEIETNGTAKKRRKRGAIDRSYRLTADELEADELDMDMSPQKRTKKLDMPPARAQAPVLLAQYKPSLNRYARLEQLAPEEDESLFMSEDELIEDEEEEDKTGGYDHYFKQNGGPDQDLDDDDDLVEEDSPDEDEYSDEEEEGDEGDDEGHHNLYAYDGRLQQSKVYYDDDAPTPNTNATSRATSSGPGATVEDAIALSDSD